MIRNIVFDMGMVLLRYEPLIACLRYAQGDREKALRLKAAIFDSPDWIKLDSGDLTEEGLAPLAQARLEDEAERALVPKLLSDWHLDTLYPLAGMEQRGEISLSILRAGEGGVLDTSAIDEAVTPQTRLCILTHASNVTGTLQPVRELIAAAPGCKLTDDLASKVYPMPLDTSDQDLVYVGRIRDDLTDERGLNLWCCGDQVRKGAATNTVQIAELLLEK